MFVFLDLLRRNAEKSQKEEMMFKHHVLIINKPAAQAAGADPSRWSSTSRQNLPIQQNRRNFWTNTAILIAFRI